MFPFSFSRIIEVPIPGNTMESASEKILSLLAERISAEKPRSMSSNQRQITFSGGPFRFVGKWNLLFLISHGVIDVVPDNDKLLISYKVWFTEWIIITSLLAMLGLAFFALSSSLEGMLVSVVGLWCIYLGNVIIAAMRFHKSVRSIAD